MKTLSAIDIHQMATDANQEYWRDCDKPGGSEGSLPDYYARTFGDVILARQDRITELEQQVERLKSIASNGWIEAWHCGNQFMALPPDDDQMTVMRCWEESQTKRELGKAKA